MKRIVKIVLTGAESTGKSTLAQNLAVHYHSLWIPELAREYVAQLNGHYTFNDVENIAHAQIENERILNTDKSPVFFDTWLIITKVWFNFVYGKHPAWLHNALLESSIDLFLLCDIDIPWVNDPLRENGGENRKKLQQIYINELINYGFNYAVVRGLEDERLNNAISIIDRYLESDPADIKK